MNQQTRGRQKLCDCDMDWLRRQVPREMDQQRLGRDLRWHRSHVYKSQGLEESAGSLPLLVLRCISSSCASVSNRITRLQKAGSRFIKVGGTPIAGEIPKKVALVFLRQTYVDSADFSIACKQTEQQCSNSHYLDLPLE
jgi:hypothetical protein